MHRFDEAFGAGALGYSMRQDALKTAKEVRDHYILPSLAYILGMDQFNLRLNPEVWFDYAQAVLKREEFSDPYINRELRHKLRCLFSSMGHTYSLEAMATSSQAANLGSIARQWFTFKSIDPDYMRRISSY